MSLVATLAGQAFANSGLGAVHALTYPLAMECDLGHGLANGVLLPHVMRYNVPTEVEPFADVASEHSEHDIDRNPRAMDREDVIGVFAAAERGREA